MQLSLNIPDFTPLALNESVNELSKTIKLNTALMLFKNSKFSLEQASEFAGLSIYQFIIECKKNKISIISYDEDELKDELNLMKNL
jgi:predicted HTH domain antitoxin